MESPAAGGSPAATRAGVACGHPREETGRGQQPPPSNNHGQGLLPWPGPTLAASVRPEGRGRIAGGPPALGRRRRPAGVACGHPKEVEGRGLLPPPHTCTGGQEAPWPRPRPPARRRRRIAHAGAAPEERRRRQGGGRLGASAEEMGKKKKNKEKKRKKRKGKEKEKRRRERDRDW